MWRESYVIILIALINKTLIYIGPEPGTFVLEMRY